MELLKFRIIEVNIIRRRDLKFDLSICCLKDAFECFELPQGFHFYGFKNKPGNWNNRDGVDVIADKTHAKGSSIEQG